MIKLFKTLLVLGVFVFAGNTVQAQEPLEGQKKIEGMAMAAFRSECKIGGQMKIYTDRMGPDDFSGYLWVYFYDKNNRNAGTAIFEGVYADISKPTDFKVEGCRKPMK